ncbi:Mth938-like domain-containing protein [Kangiella geojedonensis]|uniref:Mth938-like domain-containing protein n=1 Tax=Kangiella geojedonensis TaxID=914150 RepID=A0A0F6RCI4_9GAMM|nr:Mth938-like domain-containing protein [Kangiella geojedonensis]AKE52433.1 hypothetical protein TQ33_1486 [Kangiella geojedonensis]
MDISLDTNAGDFQIRSYRDRAILINAREYREPLTLSLNKLDQHSLPETVEAITVSALKELKIQDYEAVLLGTGPELIQPSWEIIEAAQMMGAPLEVMSTGAACRTFTILSSEGRQVLAILYP